MLRRFALPLCALTLSTPAWAGSWSHTTVSGVTVDLYVPTSQSVIGDGRALLVAMHGCTQTANDLKTRGNFEDAADAYGVVIALPTVPNGGTIAGCWNYYGSYHSRSSGDAGSVISLTQALVANSTYGIDADQVYVTGLSSGAGMAIVVGCLAPDLYAGVSAVAGPALGTSSSQIGSVATTASSAASTCRSLASSYRSDFATQVASVLQGDSDYIVATGYLSVNAEMYRRVYEAEGATLTSASFSVSDLEGYNPAGTGTAWNDGDVDRVSMIRATGMGHAWPAGVGSGWDMGYVDPEGVEYAWYLAEFFAANNLRAESAGTGDTGGGGGEDTGDTGIAGGGEDTGDTGVAGGGEDTGVAGGGEDTGVAGGGEDTGDTGVAGGGEDTGGAPEPDDAPEITLDAATVASDCALFEGTASDDHGLDAVWLEIDGASVSVTAGDTWSVTVCGLSAGCHDAVAYAEDDAGQLAASGTLTVEVEGEPWVSVVDATVMGHLSRFGMYSGGWGVSDATFVQLFSTWGMFTSFPLYLGTDGDWYVDPANLPGAGESGGGCG
ncbi:MAG: PHB depolymerase family esterase [Alphaproteobacteria bacterium]|nr:PHB depolymerase family esterase [Alphaproteobacteria bacterium]